MTLALNSCQVEPDPRLVPGVPCRVRGPQAEPPAARLAAREERADHNSLLSAEIGSILSCCRAKSPGLCYYGRNAAVPQLRVRRAGGR